MYPLVSRILLLPFKKQLTCTVRPTSFVVPVKSYHTSGSLLLKSHPLHLKFRPNASRLVLPHYSRHQPNPTFVTRKLSSTAPMATGSISAKNAADELILDSIPAPPSIPVETEAITEIVKTTLAEPAFSEIGLGGYWPTGLVQSCLEYLHIGFDLPWWGCITVGVLTVRLLMFPLVIRAQQNAARMANNMPQMAVLQEKMTQARLSGNQIEAAQAGFELQTFMNEKGVNPLKNMIVPLLQAPVFMSFFFGLKAMANAPVASMQYGGLFWFTDLTIADPYYLLPILTSVTMWATIELGTDSARLNAQGSPLMMYFMRALPVMMIPVSLNFSSAILCYWLTTNLISLVQVGFLRIPTVRDYFKIERLITITPLEKKGPKKGFMQNMQEAFTNSRITAELNDRQRFKDAAFKRAGSGPIQKTYAFDPTRQKTAQKLIQQGIKETKKIR